MALEQICRSMRAEDKAEIYAMRPHDSWYTLAWEAYVITRDTGRGMISWHAGRPVAFAAFTEVWPGRWQVWMFGTDEFKHGAIPLLRWFRKEANDILSVCHGHRLDCDSLVGHDEAHRMIKAMGGIEDGPPMRKYGKGGEDFQRFAWFNGENDAVLKSGYVRADLEKQEAN